MKIIPILIIFLLSGSACTAWDVFSSDTIKDDEEVIFFPAEARQSQDNEQWIVRYHGWIFEPETFGEINGALRTALGISKQGEEDSLLQKRLNWFKVDNERGKQLTIQIADKTFKLNPSEANGHFSGDLPVSAAMMKSLQGTSNSNYVNFKAVTDKEDTRAFAGQIQLIDKTGLSVISDIDDTIKISNVIDKKELLINTFMRAFKVAPGMPALYQQWRQDRAAVFHYVSASPWQLYPDLSQFMQSSGFPQGLFHMKLFRWKDSSFLNLFADPVTYKMEIIEAILKRHPQRRFILVGDSGEKDPEVYGMIAREYPHQIERILIRKVGNDNSDVRFNSAFTKLDPDMWQTFTQTGELSTAGQS